MIRTDKKTLCSGCGVCAQVCPKACISFEKDALGSLYARVDEKMCIDCGSCQTVCPMQQTFDSYFIGINAYAAFTKEKNIRFRGSSGGVFETISDWVINQNGSVFASGFDKKLKLRMVEALSYNEVRLLTKSKYLQSDIAYIFPIIKERVKQGKTVLVCATPCQITALKKYLGIYSNTDSLYLIDFFCHGVPSQEMFNRCIDYVEQRDGMKILSYEFRSKKKNGATPHYYTIKYKKKERIKEKLDLYFNDPFYLGFQKYLILRDSCYNCPYGEGNHAGDITIGDFHEIDKYVKGINRFDGVSTVIVNNARGQNIWKNIENSLVVYPMDLRQLVSDKQVYSGGTEEPERRPEFVKDMEIMEFENVVEKWFNSKNEWKKAIYYRLPRFIRNCIKEVIGT